MSDKNETQMSEEEMALARKGEALIKAEVARVHAPQALRERIEADRARAARQPRLPFWRRHRFAVLGTGVAALVLAAGVATQTGGGGGEPSLAEVDAVAALSPTKAAPASAGGNPPVLDASVGAIEFPDWQGKFGVKAVGLRKDEVSGRPVTTVFYRDADGARLGYSVVGGDPLDETPPGARSSAKTTPTTSPRRPEHRRHLDPAGPHLRDRRLRRGPRGPAGRAG